MRPCAGTTVVADAAKATTHPDSFAGRRHEEALGGLQPSEDRSTTLAQQDTPRTYSQLTMPMPDYILRLGLPSIACRSTPAGRGSKKGALYLER